MSYQQLRDMTRSCDLIVIQPPVGAEVGAIDVIPSTDTLCTKPGCVQEATLMLHAGQISIAAHRAL